MDFNPKQELVEAKGWARTAKFLETRLGFPKNLGVQNVLR